MPKHTGVDVLPSRGEKAYRYSLGANLPAVAAVALLAACASPNSRIPDAKLNAAPEFWRCYDTVKRPWLVDVVAENGATDERIDQLVRDFVPASEAARRQAKARILDRRAGKNGNSEQMAGTLFAACLTEHSSKASISEDVAVGCFKEQRVLLQAMAMRQEQHLDMNETTQRLVAANSDERVRSAIRRLVKDTYLLLKPGDELAFSFAEFNVCTQLSARPTACADSIQGTQRHLFHSMYKDRQAAENAYVKIMADTTEPDLARLNTEARRATIDAATRASGGDLGYIAYGQFERSFESAVFDLPPRTLSHPIRSSFGWHLVWVDDVVDSQTGLRCQP